MVPAASISSAPSSGVWVETGDVTPSSEPRNTRASHPAPATGSGAWCSKPGSTSRASPGRATHSWAPCSTDVPGVETSEWLIPRPAVIRLTSPGRTMAWWPAESRCSISPVKSQLDRLQPGVRVRGHDHAPGLGDRSGP